MNADIRFRWRPVVRMGLLGGVIALFLCLVGIIEASNRTQVISGVLTVGQTILIISIMLPAVLAVRSLRAGGAESSRLSMVVGGALASAFGVFMLLELPFLRSG